MKLAIIASAALGLAICGAPAIHDGVAWAGSHDKTLYLLDTATGSPVGKFEGAWEVCCTPSVSGGVVFYPDWGGGDTHDYAITLGSGKILCKFEAGAPAGTPVPYEGKVLLCAGSNLFALE